MALLKSVLNTIAADYQKFYNQKLEIYSASPLSGGCVNQASQLKTNVGNLFLKWNTAGSKDLFEQEALSLKELNRFPNEFLTFPKPLLWRKISRVAGYLLTSYLEIGYHSQSDDNLGRGLATLHLNQASRFGFTHNNYCGDTLQNNQYKSSWLQFYKENRLEFLINKIGQKIRWTSREENTIGQFLVRLEKLLPNDSKPALVHGDLWSGNYLLTNDKPALIDPCVSYSDHEFEFGILTLFGGFSQRFFSAYNEINPFRTDWQQRNNIYQLYHLLNHYYMFGGSYKHQSLELMKAYL